VPRWPCMSNTQRAASGGARRLHDNRLVPQAGAPLVWPRQAGRQPVLQLLHVMWCCQCMHAAATHLACFSSLKRTSSGCTILALFSGRSACCMGLTTAGGWALQNPCYTAVTCCHVLGACHREGGKWETPPSSNTVSLLVADCIGSQAPSYNCRAAAQAIHSPPQVSRL
jgi:hypothetical protein